MKIVMSFILILLSFTCNAFSKNTEFDDFNTSKKVLMKYVYSQINRTEFYCGEEFDEHGNIIKHVLIDDNKRANRIEWDHIVPAKRFGVYFKEWKDGSPECKKDGKYFKGRKCADQESKEYRYIQSDLYNLVPSNGLVIIKKSDYDIAEIRNVNPLTNECKVKISNEDKKFEPSNISKGQVARIYLYMASDYMKYFQISSDELLLFDFWNNNFPVTEQECKRAFLIEKLQGNENLFISEPCRKLNLYSK